MTRPAGCPRSSALATFTFGTSLNRSRRSRLRARRRTRAKSQRCTSEGGSRLSRSWPASAARASAGERQCLLEDVCKSALHTEILMCLATQSAPFESDNHRVLSRLPSRRQQFDYRSASVEAPITTLLAPSRVRPDCQENGCRFALSEREGVAQKQLKPALRPVSHPPPEGSGGIARLVRRGEISWRASARENA